MLAPEIAPRNVPVEGEETRNNMAAKKTATATKKAPGDAKRKPNAAFMAPHQPSPELAKIVGSEPLPRTEVTKKLWEYIKANKCQDGRTINPDEKLKGVLGSEPIDMLKMTGVVSKHLTKVK